ncbi:MAG: (Fe-S)-binding protein [Chromatiales bacterium]|nr:(Fe-S)-binding protein [Chromatiales bacterium]
MRDPEARQTLKVELDRCVKCGMCLPECPTYRLEANENESPRGRLALIEGLLNGRLQDDKPLRRHLDNCLTCRRCERICPSQVRYGHLIDQARSLLSDDAPRRLSALVQNRSAMTWGTRLARAVPAALSLPLGPLHRLHELGRALAHGPPAPRPGEYPTDMKAPRGRVGLFLGCAGAAQQGGALQAASKLLRRAGYQVSVPAAAGCCGAMSQHSGDLSAAAQLADINRSAFGPDLDAVVSIASGCGIHIDSYQPAMPSRHLDIVKFLLDRGGFTGDDFAPLPRQVLLHTPCSIENVYRGAGWARALLALIPQLEILSLGEAGQCCGAAGDYMLRRPGTAARLRQPLLDRIPPGTAHIVLTGNVGCAMHLADGLRDRDPAVEVLHPVELLARQLRDRPSA